MAVAKVAVERHALLWSMAITAALGALGVLWGVISESQMILLDGGPKLYVEIDGVVGADVTVAQEHQVRQEIAERLEELPYDVWLNVAFLPRGAHGST